MAKAKKTKLPTKVVNYLEKHGVKHEILEHKIVYTAYDAAQTMKKELDKIAKSLVVKADKDYFLVLIPANHNLDFAKLKKAISKIKDKDVKVVKIPGEKIMENALKIKSGALTAFGNLHKLPVIVDKNLEKAKKAIFSSGSLNHSIEMAVKDFVKMEEAVLENIGAKKKIKKQKTTPPKRKKAATTKKKSTGKKKNPTNSTKKKTTKKPVSKKKK